MRPTAGVFTNMESSFLSCPIIHQGTWLTVHHVHRGDRAAVEAFLVQAPPANHKHFEKLCVTAEAYRQARGPLL